MKSKLIWTECLMIFMLLLINYFSGERLLTSVMVFGLVVTIKAPDCLKLIYTLKVSTELYIWNYSPLARFCYTIPRLFYSILSDTVRSMQTNHIIWIFTCSMLSKIFWVLSKPSLAERGEEYSLWKDRFALKTWLPYFINWKILILLKTKSLL